MDIEQCQWKCDKGWLPQPPGRLGPAAQLVLAFGALSVLKEPTLLHEIRAAYPEAHLVGCSTAGEIYGARVFDDSLVVTAVHFAETRIQAAQVKVGSLDESFQAGQALAQAFEPEGLKHIFVLSDGLTVNGTGLVNGLTQPLPPQVAVTGGLAGDGPRFQQTLTLLDQPPETGAIVGLGFYGEQLKVGYGSVGGWNPFGVEWVITRSKGSVLYELDGKSALWMYKQYLGRYAADLPASALMFPLSVRGADQTLPVVRTILAYSEKEQSLTFAGDVQQGAYARFMKTSLDHLVSGAERAARVSLSPLGTARPDLAILISCVGRKLVLKQRVEEEVEAVRSVLGERPVLAGFYSYGEIAPFEPGAKCELHNQTMTITTFAEG